MRVKIRKVEYVEREIDQEQLMTQAQASEILGITVAGVRSAMNREVLPTVLFGDIKTRFTLREAVEKYKVDRSTG